jgi:carboxypeptidase T
MKMSIKSVRGTDYAVRQSLGLYPTSGTSHDYFYSRHFVKATERKILAYTIEIGKQQPPPNPFAIPFSEAEKIIPEVSADSIEFCLASI